MREIGPDHYEIMYAELFASGGSCFTKISDDDTTNSVYPSITLDNSSDSHVIWVDYRNCGCPEIYYSKVQDQSGNDLTSPDTPISDLDGIPSGRAVGFPPLDESTTTDGHIATYIEHPDIDFGLDGNVHIVWSDARDSKGTLYAGSTDPGKVYEYSGSGTTWTDITNIPTQLGYSVLCLAEYNGDLYAGTMSESNFESPSCVGKVWKYVGGNTWAQIGGDLDRMVNVLVVYNDRLYAGTGRYNGAKLYQLVGSTWVEQTVVASTLSGWQGIRSAYVWKDWLYLGDHGVDKIGRFNGASCQEVAYLDGSCIWDFMCYEDWLYASAYYGRIHGTTSGPNWIALLNPDPAYLPNHREIWEMEVFKNKMYFGTDCGVTPDRAWLCTWIGGSIYSTIWEPQVSNSHEGIISMTTNGNMLYIGMGREITYFLQPPATGAGKVYEWDGISPNPSPISDTMGIGVQSLLWKPELSWEVYYQQQNIASSPIIDDSRISLDDHKNSMCPAIACGEDSNGDPAVHIVWQDKGMGAFEIYYEQLGADPVDDQLVSWADCESPFDPGSSNSASPDIDTDNDYIHITWMDQRSGWWGDNPDIPSNLPNSGIWIPHRWDDQNDQWYWEIYKVTLELDGTFFCGQGGCVKRQSDMVSWRGRGRYTGPPLGTDGYSMYPRIAVEPGSPKTDHTLCTHITWHDDKWVENNWDISYTELQSYCENPHEDKRVTTDDKLDMYPDVSLDPRVSPQRAHLKWQTDRNTIWQIFETRRIWKGDPHAQYIIAEFFREESPADMFTINLHRLYPEQNATADGTIAYGATFGICKPGSYRFRVRACDSAGYEYSTEWIDGPKVLPEMEFLTGIYSTFDLHYDVANQHNFVELYIRITKKEYSNMVYDIEIIPEIQEPMWEGIEAVGAPVGWNFKEIGNGVKFYTETDPLLLCQRVKFTFRVEDRRISWYIRIHVTDQAHESIGMIISTRWWLYCYPV